MSLDNPKNISGLIINQFPEYYREEGRLFVDFVTAYYEWMESKTNRIHHIINPKKEYVQVTYGNSTVTGFNTHFTNVFSSSYAHANSIAIYRSNNEFDYDIYEIDYVVNNTVLVLKDSKLPDFSSDRAIHGHVLPQANPTYYTRRMKDILDIDDTLDEFIVYFKEQYLKNIQFSTITDTKTLVKNSLSLYRSKGTPRSVDLLFRIAFGVPAKVYYPQVDIFSTSSGKWFIPKYLELAPADFNINFVNKQVIGITTGAKAFVESVVRRTIRNRIIDVAYISAINGSFSPGEKINTITNPYLITECPTIIGSMNKIDMETDGFGNSYSVGDKLEVYSHYGDQGYVRVANTANSDGELTYVLIDGGYGYTANAQAVISEKVAIISDIVPTSKTAYFTNFETLKQPLANIVYNTASVANAWSQGDLVYAYDTGVLIGTGTVMAITESNSSAGEMYVSLSNSTSNLNVGTIYTASNTSSAIVDTYTDKTITANVIGYYTNVVIGVSGISGTFEEGEVVGGNTAGNGIFTVKYGTVGSNAKFSVVNTHGAFQIGDTITGNTSGATATISNLEITVGLIDISDALVAVDNNFIYGNTLGTTGSINNVSTGYGANLSISSNLEYTETININDDIIGDYLSTRLDAVAYQIPGDYFGNLTSNTIDNILNYETKTIGRIRALASQNPGDDYNIRPIIKFLEPDIYSYSVPDTVVAFISNGTSDFLLGEIVTQNSTSFRGIVESVNSSFLSIKRLRFQNDLITTTNSTTTLFGETSGAIANVDVTSEVSTEILGFNANVDIDVIVANGVITAVDVLDSGFGFKDGEPVYVKSTSNVVPLGYANQQTFGTGRGFYQSRDGFLSNYKKLQDGHYWQTHSYEVRSSVTLDRYKEMLRQVVHVAGHAMFGNLVHLSVSNTLISFADSGIATQSFSGEDDTLSASVVSTIEGVVEYTNINDATESNTTINIVATFNKTEVSDSLLSPSGPIDAIAAITEATDDLTTVVDIPLTATFNRFESSDTADVYSDILTEANVTFTESADYSAEPLASITTTASITEAADSLASNTDVAIEATATVGSTYVADVFLSEGPNGSDSGDEASPYERGLFITPPANSFVVMALSYAETGPGNTTVYDDGGTYSWEEQITVDNPDATTGDLLRTTVWSARMNNSPGTFKVSFESDSPTGPAVWKFLYFTNTNPGNEIVQIANVSAESQNTSGPILEFDNATNSNSIIVAITGAMSPNTAAAPSANMADSNWTEVRNYTRFNQIADANSSVLTYIAYREGGVANAEWDYVSSANITGFNLVALEIGGESVTAGDSVSATATVASVGDFVIDENFSSYSDGQAYTSSYIADDFNYPESHPGSVVNSWTTGLDSGRVTIQEESGDKFMRVQYPSGSSGHIQWRGNIRPDSGTTAEDVTMSFRVRFNDVDLAASGGGKVHGVGGGDTPTGGQDSADGLGWTVRTTWQTYTGSSTVAPFFCCYVYDMDKPNGSYGREIAWASPLVGETLNQHYNNPSNRITIQQNVWYHIETRYVMNTPGSADGILQVWLDGEMVLNISNMRYRSDYEVGVDSFIFNGYFGGPGVTSGVEYIDYDDFRVIINEQQSVPTVANSPQIIGSSDIQNTFTFRTSDPDAAWDTGLDEGRLAWAPDPAGSATTCLRMEVKANTRGIIQWLTDIGNGGWYEDVEVEFDIMFKDAAGGAFDFQVVGKFPGLAGGSAPNSGRPITSDGRGFSCRHQWVVFSSAQTKHFTTYMYDLDSGGSTASGENIYFETTGDPTKSRHDLSSSGASPSLQDDTWYRVRQRVVMNTPGSANGKLYEWVDGVLALQLEDCRFRLDYNHGIDVLFWQIMFGGSDNSTYRASKDSYLYFKNVKITVNDTGTVRNIVLPSLT